MTTTPSTRVNLPIGVALLLAVAAGCGDGGTAPALARGAADGASAGAPLAGDRPAAALVPANVPIHLQPMGSLVAGGEAVSSPVPTDSTIAPAAACGDRDPAAPRRAPAPSALVVSQIEPARVQKLSVSPSDLIAGDFAVGSVTVDKSIDMPVTVNLASSAPDLVRVPESVFLERGRSSANFPVVTAPGRAGCSRITARIGTSSSRSVVVYVHPAPASSAVRLSLSDSTVVGLGGVTLRGTIHTTTDESQEIRLSSSSPLFRATVLADSLRDELEGHFSEFVGTVTETVETPSCTVVTATAASGSQSQVLLKISPAQPREPLPPG